MSAESHSSTARDKLNAMAEIYTAIGYSVSILQCRKNITEMHAKTMQDNVSFVIAINHTDFIYDGAVLTAKTDWLKKNMYFITGVDIGQDEYTKLKLICFDDEFAPPCEDIPEKIHQYCYARVDIHLHKRLRELQLSNNELVSLAAKLVFLKDNNIALSEQILSYSKSL